MHQSLKGNLPPLIPRVSGDMYTKFLAMQKLSISELSTIAQGQIETEVQKRHLLLLEQNSQDMLTDDEREELRALRQRADLFTLQKAYAWALLRWHGHPMPRLADLPLGS